MTVIANLPRMQPADNNKQSKSDGEKNIAVKINNISTKEIHHDILHLKAKEAACKLQQCVTNRHQKLQPREKALDSLLVDEARTFLNIFFASIDKDNDTEYNERIHDIEASISLRGDYDLTNEELTFGSKLAWRNLSSSLTRVDWSHLHVLDCRHAKTAKEMFDALCDHLKHANTKNEPVLSVFPQVKRGQNGRTCRIWNSKLIDFAAYELDDGSIMGDPANVHFTRVCEKLGWRGKRTATDVLPLVVNAADQSPEWFVWPEELVRCVHLRHDTCGKLDLKWPAVASASDFALKIGGMDFNAVALTHVHVSSDVSTDLLSYKPNVLQEIANGLGLDSSVSSTLWKEFALIELNAAILSSFRDAEKPIVDHHTAADRFLTFFKDEQKLRGGCPGDWSRLVPPISSAVMLLYHQEMIHYQLTPCLEKQQEAWLNYQFQQQTETISSKNRRKLSFATIAKCIMWLNRPFMRRTRATVIYGSETGRSESFAENVSEKLNTVFRVKMLCMKDFDLREMSNTEQMLIVVTSTFGNGGAPENGKKFFKNMKNLCDMDKNNNKTSDSTLNLDHIQFAVFALGSTAYPDFCHFGQFCNDALLNLGAKQIIPIVKADELRGQEKEFMTWSRELFESACSAFKVVAPQGRLSIECDADSTTEVRLLELPQNTTQEPLRAALSKLHHRNVSLCRLTSRKNLLAPECNRTTMFLQFSQLEVGEEQQHEPGNHMAVFPSNPRWMVDALIDRLGVESTIDVPVQLQKRKGNEWMTINRLPPCTLMRAFTNFLAINTAPEQSFLSELAKFAQDNNEKEKIKLLATDIDLYMKWRDADCPSLLDVLFEFPSVMPDPAFLLARLPLLQPRLYSISNSSALAPHQIHLTVGVLVYSGQTGTRLRFGLCSNFLDNLPIGCDVPYYIKKADHFSLPPNNLSPILMVGAGTGIAPLRSIWQHKQFEIANRSNVPISRGRMMLYFGCRHPALDHLFCEETAEMRRLGVLAVERVAYSRIKNIPKTYVQHLLQQDEWIVWNHILEGGHIYICGEATMAADVRGTIMQIVSNCANMTIREAKQYFNQLKEDGRLHEDIFTSAGSAKRL